MQTSIVVPNRPAPTRGLARTTPPAPAPLAGMAYLAVIARHWRVGPATAKAILIAAGIRSLRRGRGYYSWSAVWRLEGAAHVEPADMEAYREPLLDKHEVAKRYGIQPRTARRWLAEGQVPAIRLSARILRAREIDLDRADDALLAEVTPAASDPFSGRAGPNLSKKSRHFGKDSASICGYET